MAAAVTKVILTVNMVMVAVVTGSNCEDRSGGLVE